MGITRFESIILGKAFRAVPWCGRFDGLRASFAALGAEISFALHGRLWTHPFSAAGEVLGHYNSSASSIPLLPEVPTVWVEELRRAARRDGLAGIAAAVVVAVDRLRRIRAA